MLKAFETMKQAALMSVRNIISNKMRSFLTTLGIIIGVMSVISLVTIVEGVENEVLSEFSDMGAGVLTVNAYGTALKGGLSEADIAEISEIDNVSGVAPSISFSGSAVRNGEVDDEVTVLGVNEVYFIHNDVVSFGRPLYSIDMTGESYVCIVDSDFAKTLFYGENPIGQSVILNGITYKVVGLQTGDDSSLTSSMSRGTNGGRVMIPYKNAMKMSGQALVQSLDVYVEDTDKTNETQTAIEELLYKTFNNNDDSYWIMNLDSLLDTMNSMMSMLKGMLTGIASIALLVGGIGIMNMMLVSVTERTKEIGLRKALGAEPSRIQLQFLFEAIVLSLTGGVIGLILGLVVSAAVSSALGIGFTVSVSAIELGVGFSAAVGIIFGWAPAKKASELNPIDALRSE
ncbi:MAG: ABC transporter permease [Oscillospiraceae bacterium]|nr:ABC transporter permease [Oscillospiraceae bacterium]